MTVLTAAISYVAIKNISSINEGGRLLYQNGSVPMQHLSQITYAYQRQRAYLRDMFLAETADRRQSIHTEIKKLDDKIYEDARIYEELLVDPKGKEQYVDFEEAFKTYEELREEIISLLLVNQDTAASVTMNSSTSQSITSNIQILLDEMFAFKLSVSEDQFSNNVKLSDLAINSMIVIISISVVSAISLGVFISSNIGRPVNKLVQVADQLAHGDVEAYIDFNSKDEIGQLASAFKSMVENIRYQAHVAQRISEGDLSMEVQVKGEKDILGKSLRALVDQNNDVLSNIKSSAEQLSLGAKQVSDLSVVLSQGATEQASSIEELTASMEEMSAQTKLNAENSSRANGLSRQAIEKAEIGSNQMKEMLTAMDEINISSNNINKIIKVIDDIAFQTNILALNAAVEAARVGQYGKGFAVVAEEVRTLAARSANAANETTELIRNSINKVDEGTKIAKSTAESLNEIVLGVEKAAILVGEIATASNEQAIGVEQINQGIMQVSNVVQTNSATSEEGAATSEELSSQAELLASMVSRYKLKVQNAKSTNMDDLNPELLSMLESMGEKQRAMKSKDAIGIAQQSPKIILSDSEFGKY